MIYYQSLVLEGWLRSVGGGVCVGGGGGGGR